MSESLEKKILELTKKNLSFKDCEEIIYIIEKLIKKDIITFLLGLTKEKIIDMNDPEKKVVEAAWENLIKGIQNKTYEKRKIEKNYSIYFYKERTDIFLKDAIEKDELISLISNIEENKISIKEKNEKNQFRTIEIREKKDIKGFVEEIFIRGTKKIKIEITK